MLVDDGIAHADAAHLGHLRGVRDLIKLPVIDAAATTAVTDDSIDDLTESFLPYIV